MNNFLLHVHTKDVPWVAVEPFNLTRHNVAMATTIAMHGLPCMSPPRVATIVQDIMDSFPSMHAEETQATTISNSSVVHHRHTCTMDTIVVDLRIEDLHLPTPPVTTTMAMEVITVVVLHPIRECCLMNTKRRLLILLDMHHAIIQQEDTFLVPSRHPLEVVRMKKHYHLMVE